MTSSGVRIWCGAVVGLATCCWGWSAWAGDPCRNCRGAGAGAHTAYGDTGCGPRYCGEKHGPRCPDPCDACNRWRGCNGATQSPEWLAPWQLPPGRGFQSPASLGYQAGPCRECGTSPWGGLSRWSPW